MIVKAREVIIQTHPEPHVVRAVYASEWMRRMVVSDPQVIDPNGTILFLQEIDDLFTELGLVVEPDEPPEPGGFEHPVYSDPPAADTTEEDG